MKLLRAKKTEVYLNMYNMNDIVLQNKTDLKALGILIDQHLKFTRRMEEKKVTQCNSYANNISYKVANSNCAIE